MPRPRHARHAMTVCCTALGVLVFNLLLVRPAFAQAYDAVPIQTSLAFESACADDASVELRRGASLLFFTMHDAALVAFARAGELDPECALAGWGEAMAIARLPAFAPPGQRRGELSVDSAGLRRGELSVDSAGLRRGDAPRWAFDTPVAMARGRAALARAVAGAKASTRDRSLIAVTQTLFDASTSSAALRIRMLGDGMHGLAHADPANVLALGSAVLSDLVRTTLPDDEPVRSARDRIAHAYRDSSKMPAEIAFLRLLVSDDAAGETMALAARMHSTPTPTPATAHVAARVFHRVGRWDDAMAAADTAWRTAGGWFEPSMLEPAAWIGVVPEWAIVASAQRGGRDRIAAVTQACAGAVEVAATSIDDTLAPRVAAACVRSRVRAWWTEVDWQSSAPAQEPPRPSEGASAGSDVETSAIVTLARGLQQARAAWPRGQPEFIAGARSAMKDLEALANEHPADARAIELDRLLVAMALAASYESRDDVLVYELQAGDVERMLDLSRQRAPRLVGVNRLAGELHLRLHDYRDAREHFARALVRQPNDARSLLGLARAATRLGDVAAAHDAAQRFLALWSTTDQARGEVVEAAKLAK